MALFRQLGSQAYNDGVKGNKAKGVLSAEERGVLDMDRQYNAVNFQYFAQQAGVSLPVVVPEVRARAREKERTFLSNDSLLGLECHFSPCSLLSLAEPILGEHTAWSTQRGGGGI